MSAVLTASRPTVDVSFAEQWNVMPRKDRKRIRRMVRLGRTQDSVADARLALGFAAYQKSRFWFQKFWFWFVPLVVAAFLAAGAVHPLLMGIILGLAGNAIWCRRNFNRVEVVNASLLTS